MRPVLRCSVALVLVAVLTSCSGGGSDEASKPPATTTTTTASSTTTTIRTLAASEVDRSASAYCATWADIRAFGGPALTGDATKDTAARKAHYAEVVPLAETLAARAEAAIKPDVDYVLAQAREVARTGSDAPFHEARAFEVQQSLARYALDHCAKG